MTGHHPDSPEIPSSGERGAALRTAGILLPALILASAGGFALQRTVLAGHSGVTELGTAYAYSCPGGPVVSELHSGDRVFAVGVNGARDRWLLIRNPARSSERWWVRSRDVTIDASAARLPTVTCTPPATVTPAPAAAVPATAATTPAASATVTTTGTASTQAAASPPAVPPPATASATASAPVTATKPATPTPPATTPASSPRPNPAPTPTPAPVAGGISASATQIWEYDIKYSSGTTSCNASAQEPTTSTVSVSVRNATQVTLTWSGLAAGSEQMSDQGGGTWSAVLGPFDQSTVPGGGSSPLSVTATAHGPAGTNSAAMSVTLHDCSFG